ARRLCGRQRRLTRIDREMNSELVRLSERVIAEGSKSFAAASRLLDRRARESAVLLYAWCR
ncbi:MAG: hypothetical protein AAGG65_02130, partial [Pseudomonadota bacterium]